MTPGTSTPRAAPRRALVAAALGLALASMPASVTAQVANKPLFLTGPGLPPNVLLILDNSDSMQEGLSQGRVALDWDQCAPGEDLDPEACPAGARYEDSKGSIVKRVGRSLINEYRGRINLGLMAYQQHPPSNARNDVFISAVDDPADLGTVLWRLVHRPHDVRYASTPEPAFYDPDHEGPWDSDIKRFREPHPTRDDVWVFYNVAVPGYQWITAEDGATGFPVHDETWFCEYAGNFTEDDLFPFDCYRDVTAGPGEQPVYSNQIPLNLLGTLTDSMRQRGVTHWGEHMIFSQLNQPEWRANHSPGLGYLHVPIGGFDADGNIDPEHWEAIERKLEPQRHDWSPGDGNVLVDPDWPLIAAGLTPLEGTMRTARDYFLGQTEHFGTEQGNLDTPEIPRSCDVNAAVWVTDGLPSVQADGTELGDDPATAIRQASDAIEDFHTTTDVDTYIVGFALPPGIGELDDAMPENPLDLLADSGGTGSAYDATSEDGLLDAMSRVFESVIAEATGSSAAVAANSTSLQAGSAIFQAGFDSSDWSGELRAFRLLAPAADNESLIDTSPAWDAESNLAAPTNRNLITWAPAADPEEGLPAWSQGNTVPFEFDALTQTQRDALGGEEDGPRRLDWVRGDQAHEGFGEDQFRPRQRLLGDIVHSRPLFVHAQDFGYGQFEGVGEAYTDALTAWSSERPLVMVGANDGKFHAFDGRLPCQTDVPEPIGGCSSEGGSEVFALIPNAVYDDLSELSHPNYDRRYVLDGSPRLGHVHDGSEWRRIVVASQGAGGTGVFALDVDRQEVLWEIDAEHDAFSTSLGRVLGDPVLGRAASGDWVTIIPNGYGSSQGQASLLILDTLSGEMLLEWTPNHPDNGDDNGMFTPVPVDSNGDRRIDRVYAGDLGGNLWRLDLGGNGPAQWGAPGFLTTGTQTAPLFQARDAGGVPQPITARPAVARDDSGHVNLFFGTGQYFEVGDNDPDNIGVQSLYGIRDTDEASVTRPELLTQEILHEVHAFGFDLRVTSDHTMEDNHAGWVMDLVSPLFGFQGERVVEDALIRHGDRVVFATLIPEPSDDPCDVGGGTGWIMEFDAFGGGRLQRSPWDLSGEGFGDESFVEVETENEDGSVESVRIPAHGIRSPVGIPTRPTVVEDTERRDREYKLPTGSEGQVWQMPDEERPGFTWRSWRQLR
ncbi:Neisseria PilC domain protein [Thioalkalivibrio sp. K90mix]|uniref:pilus assembly protein n=1 Tax=Thioalkalivibrio sp. (strain K90mix) TaxID=396595 RepID=UPI000195A38B|nr:PilC/PilY family type IV pilus protein [Thioalkalivibrio sp. K90mix]ADC70725.1 Neisseria PilC domain protein [Thioalkalivibrio sp. K90mix]